VTQVFTAQAADGASAAIDVRGDTHSDFSFGASGTFGGGTVAFQASFDGGTTYLDLTDPGGAVSLTASGANINAWIAR
jgi:hypothetical protein